MYLTTEKTEPATLKNAQDDVAILVPSFDGYHDLWRPFFQCLFKYWPDCPYPIFLGANYLTYEDPRVNPITIGPDRDYSSNLINMLSEIPHEWVIVMIEDILLSAPVNTEKVRQTVAEGLSRRTGLLQMLPRRFDSNVEFSAKAISENLSQLPVGLPYRVSVNLGLWSKNVLLKILKPGESAWQFEYHGSNRTSELRENFFCMNRKHIFEPPFHYVHGIIKRQWAYPAPRFLRREGIWDHGQTRSVQSYYDHLYSEVYTRLRYHAFRLAYHLWGAKGIHALVSIKAKSY